MALLSWSTQYLIGDPVIDSEHKELFRLITPFHDHGQEKHDPQEIARVLNQRSVTANRVTARDALRNVVQAHGVCPMDWESI